MRETEREKRLRRELDEVAVAFRLVRSPAQRSEGWLKAVRTAIGLPVVELARRMGVCKWDIYRLEKSEQDSRIQVRTLRRVAEAMGCELVYAHVPREGTLGAMVARQRSAEEAARKLEHEQKELRRKEQWKSPE
jgi:predicted DNA-binding mobile mystery protein A